MSPASHGRPAISPAPSPWPGQAESGLDEVYRRMLRPFGRLDARATALDAELLASGLLGTWWKDEPPGARVDPETVLGLGIVHVARTEASPRALALLRTWAVVGVTAAQREAARRAAAALCAAGVVDPPWAAPLGRVRVGGCWLFADVRDDRAQLLCTFDYLSGADDRSAAPDPGHRAHRHPGGDILPGGTAADRAGGGWHALLALIDLHAPGGRVTDLRVTSGPAATVLPASARYTAPPAVLPPAHARRLLERALAGADAEGPPVLSEDLRGLRALALARCRAMPHPAAARAAAGLYTMDASGRGDGWPEARYRVGSGADECGGSGAEGYPLGPIPPERVRITVEQTPDPAPQANVATDHRSAPGSGEAAGTDPDRRRSGALGVPRRPARRARRSRTRPGGRRH